MIPTKIYPAVIRGFEVSSYPSDTQNEYTKRLQIDVFYNEAEPEAYMECFIILKKVCGNTEPCAQLYQIFAEAEKWGDVLGERVGVTVSREGYIRKIVRTKETITEAQLIAKKAERKRIRGHYKKIGVIGMTIQERIIALLNAD